MTRVLEITEAGVADLGLIRSVAAGRGVRIAPDLLAAIQRQRASALRALADGRLVYGVNTGMGALSPVRVRGSDASGAAIEIEAEGLRARVIQRPISSG